jgi:7-cyano-7-deazaguanine synthase
MKNKALVIFSGGQDSTTCLYWALQRYDIVEAITFAYGQKHNIEIECSQEICKREGVKQTIIDISFLNTIVDSALTSNGDVNVLNDKGLPASFVPNRNQLFITLAHSYLQKIGGGDLITGVCETDYSGYPDCRRNFIDLIEQATNVGSETYIQIITPLMYLDKAETFKLADDIGYLNEVIELSHTCYNGNREIFNDWGYGCGDCPACFLRRDGYEKFKDM